MQTVGYNVEWSQELTLDESLVEYERGDVRVRQTTELTPAVANLLQQLEIPLPPKLHRVETAPTCSRKRLNAPRKNSASARDQTGTRVN